jgi:8-oxo-dGTP pyrophosphatase MutT (NUDIX family)
MQVRGVDAAGEQQFAVLLPHGADPTVLAHDLGYVVERPLDARRDADRELVLSFVVRPVTGEARPGQRPAGRDAGLTLGPDEQPFVRQRVAAYAVVVSDLGLLATQYSSRTAVDGRWGMPGGGIDPDEEPGDAVVREVHEETAQHVELGPLVAVQTSHWVGRSPTGRAEDFHAVRLVDRAACSEPGEPRVLDVGGTTADARWVALTRWRSVTWTVNWREALEQLLPR